MAQLYQSFTAFSANIIGPLSNLTARIYMGYFIFFIPGLAKLDDFEGTIKLFEGDWALPFLPAQAAAFLAMAGELILPVLLINCIAFADTDITLAELRRADQWRLEYISLREAPLGKFLPTGALPL